MKTSLPRRLRVLCTRAAFVVALVGPVCHAQRGNADAVALARSILLETGVTGGLIVHIGCGEGRLTAALADRAGVLVHGLDVEAGSVARTRACLRTHGLYGKACAEILTGTRLPYADGLVNLVVSEAPGTVPPAEMSRVLCPGGVAYVRAGDGWAKTVKPWPDTIDEWTHALYDASNNAVADDTVVGPPRHMQWVSGPAWARSHDHLASVSVVVSARGRLFSIVDEGPVSAVALPAKWFLVARDAFNGVELWRRPVGPWEGHLRGFRSGPPELSRTLVAVEDTVYVTLGYGEPVSALDAATGEPVRTYAETADALEILHHDGVLYVVTGRRGPTLDSTDQVGWRRGVTPRAHGKGLVVVNAASGDLLWRKAGTDVAEVLPMTLAVSTGRVFLQDPDSVLCLDAASGKVSWRAPRPVSVKRRGWSTPTLVVYDDVVLSADRAVTGRSAEEDSETKKVEWEPNSAGGNAPVGELIAFSVTTGERLWSCPCQECYNAPVDVLVSDGLVWTGRLVTAKQPGITQGRDPHTGEVRRERPPDSTFFNVAMNHHRCHRNRATSRHLVLGRAGVEFIDVRSGVGVADHWVRGGCQYGVLPCNGLLYAPSHSCACYIEAKLNGFWALAPAREEGTKGELVGRESSGKRLLRDPAWDQRVRAPDPDARPPLDSWPTYRHDPGRSGYTATPVGSRLSQAWRATIGGRLSAPVVAGGRVYVAQVDAHTVHALDAETGGTLWSYTAGGRVDSPPTVYGELLLFGCADGWVYCLQASSGRALWRFRAAPEERRVVAYGQLESAWPVHGSVLVEDGVLSCVAGRSSYIDGGMVLVRLDAASGTLLSETRIDSRDPETGLEPQKPVRGTYMPGALPDVLSSDGSSLYMRHTRFDRDGVMQQPNVPHLFSPAGFLDGSWWHRTYWMLGTTMGVGYGGWPNVGTRAATGRLLVLDEDRVYGFGRDLYAHYGGHVGLDSATVYHYGNRKRQTPPPRWTHTHIFAASQAAARRGPSTRKRTAGSCIGVRSTPSLDPSKRPISVEAWIKSEKEDGAIVARGAYTHGYALYLQKGRPHFAVRVDSTLHAVAAPQSAVGEWTHLAGVLTPGKQLQLYVNGTLAAKADGVGFLTTDPGDPMEIGADDGNYVGNYKPPFPFTGTIDEVRVYLRALSPAEVEAHARSTKPPEKPDTGLALYYSFDRGDARDESGHGNHGTVEGARPTDGRTGKGMAFSGRNAGAVASSTKFEWTHRVPMVIRAMVLTGAEEQEGETGSVKVLFAAGTGQHAEVELEGDTTERLNPGVLAPFAEAEGDRAGTLWALSPEDGSKLSELKLDSLPVFDGMIAAEGRLFLATTSGRVVCFRGE